MKEEWLMRYQFGGENIGVRRHEGVWGGGVGADGVGLDAV